MQLEKSFLLKLAPTDYARHVEFRDGIENMSCMNLAPAAFRNFNERSVVRIFVLKLRLKSFLVVSGGCHYD